MTAAQELFIEDIEWMVTSNEWPPRIAERAHITVAALSRALYRHGRPDLAAVFTPFDHDGRRALYG